jgi:hypothetical protein
MDLSIDTNISEENTASIFRAELRMLGNVLYALRNIPYVGIYQQVHRALQPRKSISITMDMFSFEFGN